MLLVFSFVMSGLDAVNSIDFESVTLAALFSSAGGSESVEMCDLLNLSIIFDDRIIVFLASELLKSRGEDSCFSTITLTSELDLSIILDGKTVSFE
jgi:hypothetical protein